MATTTSHQSHIGFNQGGFQSDMEGLLDLVERGCCRMMKAGGGSLPQEMPARSNRGYSARITPEHSAQIVRAFKGGTSLMEIARQQGVSFNTVCRHTREARTGTAKDHDATIGNWRENDEHHQL